MFKEKKRSYRINITKPVYCIMLTDTAEAVTYETDIKPLGEVQQVQLTVQTASGELFGSGKKVDAQNMMVGLTMAMDITKIPAASAAEIQGHEVIDGVIIDNSDDDAPYVAVGYIVEGSGGEREYIWLLKGKAQPINESVQQRTTSINYSTQTLNINFIPRDFDGNIRFYADTTHNEFSEAQAVKWFQAPPINVAAK